MRRYTVTFIVPKTFYEINANSEDEAREKAEKLFIWEMKNNMPTGVVTEDGIKPDSLSQE